MGNKIQRIYVGQNLVRPQPTTTKYVLLSSGGTVNKFSELSLNGTNCLSNNTTNWLGKVTSTDKFGIHYKAFDKPIVGFKVKCSTLYYSNAYTQLHFFIAQSGTSINTSNQRVITAGFEFRMRSQVYQGNRTGDVWSRFINNGSTTVIPETNKSSQTATGTWEGIRDSDGIWTITCNLDTGQTYSGTYDSSSFGHLYMIGFQGRRWGTGNTGYFYEAEVDLLDS